MRRKGLSILLGSICLILMLVGSFPAQALSQPIRIGTLYSLTGKYSAMGKDSQVAIEIWKEWVNEQGGIKGHLVEFVTSDDQSDPTKGALAAKKLITVEKVHAMAGCNSTGVALAVGPVAEEVKIPFVTASGSEVFEHILKPHWSFRSCTTGWEMVDWGFGVLNILNPEIKNVAVLYQGAAFGKALYKMAERYAPMRGLKIVAAEKYDPAGTDFGAQVSAIMVANPDAVAVYCADMGGPRAMKQMREMGMDKPIVTNGAINMKAVREAFKDTFSIPPYVYSAGTKPDVWTQLPKDSTDYEAVAPIASRYEEKHEDQYGWFQHLAINNMALIKHAVEKALDEDSGLLDRDLQTIRTAIRDKMETTKDLQAGGGILTVTPENHNACLPGTAIATFHFENGKIVYDPELSNIQLNHPPPMKD